jgi:cytochrome c biogenesis protein CcmG/thiol:disulfide interchange protein DsbE
LTLSNKLLIFFRSVAVLAALLFLSHGAQAQWRPVSQSGLKETPPLNLNNIFDKQISIADYKGRVVLVNFWATWCEPCKDEFGELIHLQEKYKSKGLTVLAVNLAESKPKVINFFKNNLLDDKGVEVLLDNNSIYYKTWKARWIPITYLVNKKGQAEFFWVGEISADNPLFMKRLEELLR